MSDISSKIQACVLAGAIGDAMGAPVEFMRALEIHGLTEGRGVTQYYPAYGKTGAITDDTQMTLFTIEALLRCFEQGNQNDIDALHQSLTQSYLHWFITQGEIGELVPPDESFLLNYPLLHSRRSPGNTCLSALQQLADWHDIAYNDSKGCGGVMRVAPVGIAGVLGNWTNKQVFDNAQLAAKITHGHPDGIIPAGQFALIVYRLFKGDTPTQAISVALKLSVEYPDHQASVEALNKALMLASTSVAKGQAINMLGEGWVAEEALAIAVYCLLVAPDFHQLINLSVSHSGDSDSTGSIAGNLWGAMHGMTGIPESWLKGLELREAMDDCIQRLNGFLPQTMLCSTSKQGQV